MGNRALAVFLTEGYYIYSTYDLRTNNPASSIGVPYEDRLEGSWNFIYMAYRMREAQAIGMVLFAETEQVERTQLPAEHKVMSSYARVVFAAREFGYAPFHGTLFDPRVYFGPGAYQESGQQMVDAVVRNHRSPPPSPSATRDFAWEVPRIDTSNS